MSDRSPLELALLALGYFRVRNSLFPLYKRSKRQVFIKRRAELARACRCYIRQARAVGWRGSIVKAVLELRDKKLSRSVQFNGQEKNDVTTLDH